MRRLCLFNDQKVEVNKNIQDFIYKSFYKKKNEKIDGPHVFWDTQPVPGFATKISVFLLIKQTVGPIDSSNDLEKIKKEGFKLPNGFIWCDLDINNSKDLDSVIFF